jgi:positive regulator of sigma E activity
VTLALNGIETDSIMVEDGDTISVELQTGSDCKCCETKRECSDGATAFLAQGGKGKIRLNRSELMRRIRYVAEPRRRAI